MPHGMEYGPKDAWKSVKRKNEVKNVDTPEMKTHPIPRDKQGNPLEDYLKELDKYEKGTQAKKMEIEECSVKHDHKHNKKTIILK